MGQAENEDPMDEVRENMLLDVKTGKVSYALDVHHLYECFLKAIIKDESDSAGSCKAVSEAYVKYEKHVNGVNHDGLTLLMIAARDEREGAQESSFKVMKFLVNKKVDTTVACHQGWTVLHYAIEALAPEKAEFLLEHMQEVGQATKQGNTILHLAIHYMDDSFIGKIVDRVNVSAVDSEGNTALHDAANKNRIEAIKILVSHGVDMNIENEYGKTALRVAKSNRYEEVASYLEGAILAQKDQKELEEALKVVEQKVNASPVTARVPGRL